MTAETAETNAGPEVEKRTVGVNYGGDVKQFDYEPSETVEHLITVAIARFGLTSQPHQLGLFLDGNELPRASTLEAAGVRPHADLVLKQIVVEGG
jgi:hypothetical protein